MLADPESTAVSLERPGHILPFRLSQTKRAERSMHRQAAVDLLRRAGACARRGNPGDIR